MEIIETAALGVLVKDAIQKKASRLQSYGLQSTQDDFPWKKAVLANFIVMVRYYTWSCAGNFFEILSIYANKDGFENLCQYTDFLSDWQWH